MAAVRAIPRLTVVGLLLVVFLAAGCGGSDGDDAASGGSSGVVGEDGGLVGAPDPAARGAGGGAGGEGGGEAGGGDTAGGQVGIGVVAGRVVPGGRDIVYTAEITVRVADVTAAAARVERLVATAGGVLFAEDSSTDPALPDSATVTMDLRVPPERFRALLADVAALGERVSQRQTAEDVTAQVVDVQSRLATQRESVARVRALLDRATTIADIIRIEGELARRQADLEALEAQQKRLSDLTSLASVTVTLLGPTTVPTEEDRGFLAGLRAGWAAFTGAVALALTAVGASLPFVAALLLLGLPVLWLVRRARRARPVVAGVPVAAGTAPGPTGGTGPSGP